MSLFQAIIIAIIEGITEFLPVSSTGHMILATSLMRISDDEFVKTFEIAIQLGAIMAVVVLYFKRFLVSLNIYFKLFAAFLPAGIIGFIFIKKIKAYLFNPITVSISLIVGGIILIVMDKWTERKRTKYNSLEKISYKGAFKIGLFQCISMVPGVSRAAATIFGGIFSGFNRKQATEFSFLLAIPTMFAATGYDLFKSRDLIHFDDIKLLLIGAGVAFVFAMLAVKAFIAFITRFGFKHFGYYRIALGILFLIISIRMGIKLSA